MPCVHEAGRILHHPHRDAGVRVLQEGLGEQRLAQLGHAALFPRHGGGVKDLQFVRGYLAIHKSSREESYGYGIAILAITRNTAYFTAMLDDDLLRQPID
jgi:hypothetical protein